jgi:hypothetical protein
MMTNFHKIKRISDYGNLTVPHEVGGVPNPDVGSVADTYRYTLRLLLQPKYGKPLGLPEGLEGMNDAVRQILLLDRSICEHSWCYMTCRIGEVASVNDDAWHFDGASFRTDTIPERNYVWCDSYPTEYKVGSIDIPDGFDPLRYDISEYAGRAATHLPTKTVEPKTWYRIDPFCLHRRPYVPIGTIRSFVRVSFIDVEIRDAKNTPHPALRTEAYGRDPATEFRGSLKFW